MRQYYGIFFIGFFCWKNIKLYYKRCSKRNIVCENRIMSQIADQLVAEEDEQQGREQQHDLDLINYLKEKLVRLHMKVSSYGTNVVTARGIQKLSSEFEILVFGPARVGKSTLIK